jgi:cytoskeletal protein RodZ
MSEAQVSATPAAEAAGTGESFGRWLSRERELRGISLEQIADQTRIGGAHLRALERDETSALPARVFVLGFIRAYARCIGINPDDAVLRYEEQQLKVAPPVAEGVKRRVLRKRVLALIAGIAAAAGLGAWLLLRSS